MIVFMLWGFGLPGVVHSPLIPAKPLFGFSRSSGDNIRMIGPLVGAVMALGVIPLLLYSQDAKPTGKTLAEGARAGVDELWSMLRHMRIPRDAGLFLIGRMLFADARLAALMFGGIYAAGVMKWGAPELLLMGFLAASCGILGGFLAGWMDTRLGPKIALLIEIAVMTACLFAQLTLSPTMIFLAPYNALAHGPLWTAPIFNTPPQLAFLMITMISSVVGTSVFSSSRTMLTAVAPKENIGVFFGLYALSGAATAWLAPGLVEWATKSFHSQQAGMFPIALLFIAGMTALYFVKAARPTSPR
jgi:UMF1 family MFS transporter